jgi:hypothetical protein
MRRGAPRCPTAPRPTGRSRPWNGRQPVFGGGFHSDREVTIVERYWIGLPRERLWLAWTGPAYGGPALTRTSVRPDKPRRTGWPADHVRNGDEPAAVIPDL